MPECNIDAVKKLLSGVEVSEAVLGKGVRIRAERPLTLLELPREALEALVDCEVVEIVEPNGRIVYFTREWVRRALELAREKSDSGKH